MKKGIGFLSGLLMAATAGANIGGFCGAVEVAGTNAFVGAGQILLAVDVSDPGLPKQAGTCYLPGLIEDIVVDSNTLYAACGDAGVHKVDISSVAEMERLGAYDSPGHAYGLVREGSSLFLADGVAGLHRLDTGTLTPLASFVTNAPAMDVIVENGGVYLLDHFNGVIQLDSTLSPVGGYGMVAFGNRLSSDGSSLYVTDGEGKLTQLELSSMTLVTNQLIGIPTLGSAVSGSSVFVARGRAGILEAGGVSFPTLGTASALDAEDGRLYVADGFGGLSIYDATTKSLLGTFSGVARNRATAVAGTIAYLAAGNDGVRMFDLTGFPDPVYLSTVATSNAIDVAVSGDLLLVADLFQGLELYSISSPAAPVHLGSYTPPSPAVVRCAGASGSFAFVSEGYTVRKLDLSDPAAPVVVESYDYPDYVHDLDLCGTNLFVTSGGAQSITVDGFQALEDWHMLDLSDPLTPVAVTNFGPLVRAVQMTLSGNTVYASADDGGTALVQLPARTNDSDGDGLDDVIEQRIIDHDPDDALTDLAAVLPDDDYDGDGLSNLSEQLAGTSPVDPESVFSICGLEGEGIGHSVSWYSCTGHSYTIHKSTNLVEGFFVLQSGIAATEPINTHVDEEAGSCAMYMITID